MENGTEIMKLTTMTQVSVDGVMQGNGGATEEDRRSGFERGGSSRVLLQRVQRSLQ